MTTKTRFVLQRSLRLTILSEKSVVSRNQNSLDTAFHSPKKEFVSKPSSQLRSGSLSPFQPHSSTTINDSNQQHNHQTQAPIAILILTFFDYQPLTR
jgi:hypothetical protein